VNRLLPRVALATLLLLPALGACAQPFRLPTANRALFESGGNERFFVGTVGKPWTSGMFGCVRSDGWQMHEGLDIRLIARDRRGEATDPILATADGTVAYINHRSPLSNYGIYLILRHQIEGLEIYSLYAHLKEVRPDLRPGQRVVAGERIGTMGRTTNTRQAIAKDRAHVHFELNLFLNEAFPAWYRRHYPDQRNDHGLWNGRNLLGLDPRHVFLAQAKAGPRFSLRQFILSQPELCRVLVRARDFPWVRRYAVLVVPNPVAEREGVAGYELALNFNGLPCRVVPRAASEIRGPLRVQLLSVNEAEQQRCPCRRLVAKRGARWELTPTGSKLIDLLTFAPGAP
jgi:murein DD-endopeptidase MepM/ murein hydrolase activator NlpD